MDQVLDEATNEAPAERDPVYGRASIVARILELNPSADAEFLARFELDDLQNYQRRLAWSQTPRQEHSPWVRQGLSGAIAVAESFD